MPIKNLALFSSSLLASFFIAELVWRAWIHKPDMDSLTHRTMLFHHGENFKNMSDYFKYFPNKEIRSVTLYSTPTPSAVSDIAVEYDYVIRTNNAGLVMREDINTSKSHIYVIGNSFTEGQGAAPWFYRLEVNENTQTQQLINAGILGTGPSQWQLLVDDLANEYSSSLIGAVINIIPDDMRRKRWVFSDRELSCLQKMDCDYSFGFQGFDFDAYDTGAEILKTRISAFERIEAASKDQKNDNYLQKVKEILKKSEILLTVNYLLRSAPNTKKIITYNEEALIYLKDKFDGKVIVNVIAQKGLPAADFQDYRISRYLLRFLKDHNFEVFICDIPQANFHQRDGHPNVDGYQYLEQCNVYAVDRIRTWLQQDL